jgi:transposase
VADSRKPDRHVECPRCNYRYHYHCADGRRKCRRCGKLFTHRPQGPRNRLGRGKLDEIARLFWLGVPAVRAAKDLGLHRNTTYRYYKRLRERISADREAQLSKLHGHIEADESYFGGVRQGKRGRGAAGKIPVFGLLKRGGEVRVILPECCDGEQLVGAIRANVELDSIVYTDGYKAYNHLSLNGFHHERVNHGETFADGRSHINGIENFWGYAKRRLKVYHGGFKRNFHLFIREMEFRFNHRNEQNVLNYLRSILYTGS